MNIKNITYLVLGCLVFMSCAGTKRVGTLTPSMNKEMSVALGEQKKNIISDSTVDIKTRVEFTKEGNAKPKVLAHIKIRTGKEIWTDVSFIGMSVARAMVTNQGAKAYAKVPKKVYLDSGFDVVKEKIGVDLQYDQLEALLMGCPLIALNESDYDFTVIDGHYIFASNNRKQAREGIRYIVELNNEFLVHRQQIEKPDENIKVEVLYDGYQKIEETNFPMKVSIQTEKEGKSSTIKLDHKTVKLNETLQLPFRLPDETEGYQELKIK